jgi:hypothetical protein
MNEPTTPTQNVPFDPGHGAQGEPATGHGSPHETPGVEGGRSLRPEPATIALAMPWCPWIPERVESMARLRGALDIRAEEVEGEQGDSRTVLVGPEGVWTKAFGEKATNDKWSEAVFEWLARMAEEFGADWCLQIQEDAVVPENFWPIVRAILEALPADADLVGLHVCHPDTPALAQEGVRLFTTADAFVGVCWAIRGPAMREFLEWRRTQLVEGWWEPVKPGGLPHLTEDTMVALWAMATGRRIYHPIPAPVDHDTSMASVWGNDGHANRRPRVSWEDADRFADEHGPGWGKTSKGIDVLEAPGFWKGLMRLCLLRAPDGSSIDSRIGYDNRGIQARIPHIGRFYEATPRMLARWVKGVTERQLLDAQRDNGDFEKRRLVWSRWAKVEKPSGRRVFVATPTRGNVNPQYATTLLQLARHLVALDVESAFEFTEAALWSQDLVRVRSRFVRHFLENTDATHLLFLDADVSMSPLTLVGMLQAQRPFVAAPYPRRGVVDFDAIRDAIAAGDGRKLEAHAFEYAITPGQAEFTPDRQGCVEMGTLPLGCALIERGLLERMTEHFRQVDRERVDFSPLTEPAQVAKMGRRDFERYALALARELSMWRAGHMGTTFLDRDKDRIHPTVALFALMQRDNVLLGEDGSFCCRVRDIGEKVWMYLGPGSPVDHVGEYTFEGHPEAFGLRRATAA